MSKLKILVLGVSGMLGNAVYRYLSSDPQLYVHGTSRSTNVQKHLRKKQCENITFNFDVEHQDKLEALFLTLRPDVVINCIGVIKQLDSANNPLVVIPINALLPHRLDRLCSLINSKLIHVSTDCVFSGKIGGYHETDFSDADDLYGRSKFLGEVITSNAITLRTSIIGHELESRFALVEWFLSQTEEVRGYKKAIFSGLPTIEVARVIKEHVISNLNLRGLYHLAANPINKYDLLKLIASTYKKDIRIIPDESLCIDRSLNANKFSKATGYKPPSWAELIRKMYEFR